MHKHLQSQADSIHSSNYKEEVNGIKDICIQYQVLGDGAGHERLVIFLIEATVVKTTAARNIRQTVHATW